MSAKTSAEVIIDGKVYTNSREAIEGSIKAGRKYIEIDLLLQQLNNLNFFELNTCQDIFYHLYLSEAHSN